MCPLNKREKIKIYKRKIHINSLKFDKRKWKACKKKMQGLVTEVVQVKSQ